MKRMFWTMLAVVAGWAGSVSARTVDVVGQTASTVTLRFGAADGRACRLFLAHGAEDAGDDKHAWMGFYELTRIGASEDRRIQEIPAKFRDGRFLKFFTVQTEGLPYAKELKSVRSTSRQWVDIGLPPNNRMVVDFRFGDVQYANSTAFFGRNWSGNRYLLNQQSNSFFFHSGGQRYDILPTAGEDYRFEVDDSSYGILSYGAVRKAIGISRQCDGSGNLAVFGCNDGTHLATFRFDRMKLAAKGVLLRDLLPAEDAAGVAGLYDQVGNTFYSSRTETALEAGEAWEDGRFGRVLDTSATVRFRRAFRIVEQTSEAVRFAFDNPDAADYSLILASDVKDGGSSKTAWEDYVTIATVTPKTTTFDYALPASLRVPGMLFRFFLVKTADLPYTAEVAALVSTGTQYVPTGIIPGLDTTVDFTFGDVVYQSGTALLGQGWSGQSYLLNQQGNTVFMFHGQDGKNLCSVESGKTYTFSTTGSSQAVIDDGTTRTAAAEAHYGSPLSELTVFGCSTLIKGTQYRFDALKIREKGFLVRDFVPVNIAGEGALFDTVNGVVYRNVGAGTFAKGKTLDRMGWVVGTSETLTLDEAARENIVPETPAKITLTANTVWTAEDLERVPADSTVDLNGFTLETTVETGTRNRNFQLVGKGGTFVVTVPAGQVYSACPDLMQGTISLVKRGAGTFVALGGLIGADNIIVEEGLMEMGQSAALRMGQRITVADGAAFDMRGQRDNCIDFTLAGTGPDGKGALRNTGGNQPNNVAQLAGIRLAADATISSDGSFGLINNSYSRTALELNGHTLTVDYPAAGEFWLASAQGSTAGTVVVKGGQATFFKGEANVDLPNVDFLVDGAASAFNVPTANNAGRVTVRDVTVQNGGSFKEGQNVTYVRNFNVFDGGLVPNTAVKWIYVSGTVLVSNETTDVTIYPPITNNGSYPQLVKKGAGKLTLANNHSDQRMDRGADIWGGTVVLSSTHESRNCHVAISSQPAPFTVHSGATLDLRQCAQPVKVTTLAVEEGGTLLGSTSNVIQFPNGAMFMRPEPFYYAGSIDFAGKVTFNLPPDMELPAAGGTMSLLRAGAIIGQPTVVLGGVPTETAVVLEPDQILLKMAAEGGTAPLAPIKIFTLGGNYAFQTTVDGVNRSFRGDLVKALTTEGGWNVEMTGWRHTSLFNSDGQGVSTPAWTGHSGISELALKTSATRAGVLEGLETYCLTANRPDFTLFLCGDADVSDGVAEDTIFANWTEAVSRIRTALPMTTVLAATIPNASNSFNRRLSDWCASQDEVVCVDIASLFPTVTPTAAQFAAAANAFKAKLFELATKDGKRTPTVWTQPEIVLGAENNVPSAYRDGFILARVFEPGERLHLPQNTEAVPYVVAPLIQQTDIAKVGYYVELVPKGSGTLQALWVDMDAMGPNWADVSLPVTVAQQKQQAVTRLHVWSNSRAVTQVPANDDSVSGYVEFNCLNYSEPEKNLPGAIAEPWTSLGAMYGFDDTFNTSGSSGHGCFQIMRKFAGNPVPAGEVLFAMNHWGGTGDTPYGLGIGTFADLGKHGYTSAKTLDRTFTYGEAGTDAGSISSPGFELRRISFYVKYNSAPTVDRAAAAAATWTGATNAEIWNYANWTTPGGTAPTSFDYTTWRIPEGTTVDFAYNTADNVTHWATTFLVDGTASFPATGGFYVNSLDIGPNGVLIFDPTMFSWHLRQAPTFQPGGRFALPEKYRTATKGRFLLFTVDQLGPTSDADYAAAFETASANGAHPKIVVERLDNGRGYIWLDLDADHANPKLNILCMGDSITQGNDGTYGNWRTLLMKKVCAAGYEAWTKGFWTIQSNDINGQPLPVEWTRHAGISGQRIESLNGAGTIDAVEATLDQAGDVDLVLLMLGTNDINGNNRTAEQLYPVWKELVDKILAQKPHAKVIAGAVVDIAYDAAKDAQVVAFNAKIRAAVEGGVFPANRVFFADLYTPCYRYAGGAYIPGSFYAETDLHPDWPGENKLADAYLATIQQVLAAAEDGWTPNAAEAVTDTVGGIENNVPTAARAGFKRARVFDVTKHAADNLATLGYVPYENCAGSTAATEQIARVGYYIELKRKDSAAGSYGGLVRWMWVTAEAFGDRTIDSVGVPLTTYYQGPAKRLQVKTNMPGIASTPEGTTETGWIEFWPSSYTNPHAGQAGEPGNTSGYDWSDTRSDNMAGFGSMQIHRLLTGCRNPAQTLFAFNHWTTTEDSAEIGFGNFANQVLGSMDYTFSGSANRAMVDTMGAGAYEVARIEIWTTGAAEDQGVGAMVEHVALLTEDGVTTAECSLTDLGLGAASVQVTVEWSTSADFSSAETYTKDVGSFTAPGKISTALEHVTPGTTWYVRFTTVNDRDLASTSRVSDPYDPRPAVWRPQDASATWQSVAWAREGLPGLQPFTPGWSAYFDGNESNGPAVLAVDEPVAAANVVVDAATDYTFGGAAAISTGKLVKKGAGTLTLEGAVLAGTPDIEVQAGTVKIGDDAVVGAAGSDGGTITVKNGATFDVNFLETASGVDRPRSRITRGKKFVIEGAGVNGAGALTTTAEGDFWGSTIDEIVLTGDATLGGTSRLDLRGNAKNAITGPADATLTIANTSAKGTRGVNVHGPIAVGKVDIAPGAALTLEGNNGPLTLPLGFALGGQLQVYAANPDWNVSGIEVYGNEAQIANDSGTSNIKAPVTVPAATRLTLTGNADVHYKAAITNAGTIAVAKGRHWLDGPAIVTDGNASFELTGGELYCLPAVDWSEADVRLTQTGGLLWWGTYNAGTFPHPRTIDASGLTGGTIAFVSTGDDTIPAAFAAARPTRVYVLNAQNDQMTSIAPGNYEVDGRVTLANAVQPGSLRVADGASITAQNLYLGDDANNARRGYLEIGEGGTFTVTGTTWIGHYPDLREGQKIVLDGGTFNYTGTEGVRVGIDSYKAGFEMKRGTANISGILCRRAYKEQADYQEEFTLNGGTLNLGGVGLIGWTRFLPFVEFNNGAVNATADFAVEQLRSVSFGNVADGTVDFDVANHTVDWKTGLRGRADVNLTGHGTFKSGVSNRTKLRFQGVPTGHWTISNTGVNNLYGAAGFAKGLTLEANVTANLKIAGESLVEGCFLQAAPFASAKNARFSCPFVMNDMGTLHEVGDANDFTSSSFVWQGEFYCDTPGTWTFAGNYDDNESLEVDGREVFSTTGWTDIRQGKIELAVGWHAFRIAQYQGGGGWGASQGAWKSGGMALGFAKQSVDGTDAANFTKFDGTNLRLRPQQGDDGQANWSSVAAYDANTWNTRTDLAFNGKLALSSLHVYNLALTPTFAKSTHEFSGYVFVTEEQSGFWTLFASYDDRFSLQIDGVDSGIRADAESWSSGLGYVAPGWHKFRIRVADAGGSWGPWSNRGVYCRISVNGSSYLFDETAFRISSTGPSLQEDVVHAGLDGTVELAAGSRLQNDAAGACPIWGTLKGAGTLAGPFAFAGNDNCYAVSGRSTRRDVDNRITFELTNPDGLSGLKRVKATFDKKPGCPFYDIGAAFGVQAEALEVTVQDVNGIDYSDEFTAVVVNDRLLLKNAHPNGITFFFR